MLCSLVGSLETETDGVSLHRRLLAIANILTLPCGKNEEGQEALDESSLESLKELVSAHVILFAH